MTQRTVVVLQSVPQECSTCQYKSGERCALFNEALFSRMAGDNILEYMPLPRCKEASVSLSPVTHSDCDCEGLGYAFMNETEIQRCDTCKLFPSDEAAADHAVKVHMEMLRVLKLCTTA